MDENMLSKNRKKNELIIIQFKTKLIITFIATNITLYYSYYS